MTTQAMDLYPPKNDRPRGDVPSNRAERLALYTSTAARMEAQIASISGGRRHLKWVLMGALALAVVVAFFHAIAAAVIVIAGVSVFGVGHYISAVHIAEDRHALEEARRVIESLTESD